jgi:hypothetical protein
MSESPVSPSLPNRSAGLTVVEAMGDGCCRWVGYSAVRDFFTGQRDIGINRKTDRGHSEHQYGEHVIHAPNLALECGSFPSKLRSKPPRPERIPAPKKRYLNLSRGPPTYL